MNINMKCEPKNERDYCEMFVSQRNITTHQEMSHTCHMRHICMLDDQAIKKISSCNNLLNATFQSHPIKWVVATQIRRVRLLQQSTPFGIAILYTLVQKHLTICSLKSKENIIFAHFILKQNTNHASHCFDFHLCIFSL